MGKIKETIIDISQFELNGENVVTDLAKLPDRLKAQIEDFEAILNNLNEINDDNFRQYRNEIKSKILPNKANIHFFGFFQKCLNEFWFEEASKETKHKQAQYIGKCLSYLIPEETKRKLKGDLIEYFNDKEISLYLKFKFSEDTDSFIHLPFEYLVWDKDFMPEGEDDEDLFVFQEEKIFISRFINSSNHSKKLELEEELVLLIVDFRPNIDLYHHHIRKTKKFFEELKKFSELDTSSQIKNVFFINNLEDTEKLPSLENIVKHVDQHSPNIIHFIGNVHSQRGLLDRDLKELIDFKALDGSAWLTGKGKSRKDRRKSRMIFIEQRKTEDIDSAISAYEKFAHKIVGEGCPAVGIIPFLSEKNIPNPEFELEEHYLGKLYLEILNNNSIEKGFASLQEFFFQKDVFVLPKYFFRYKDFRLIKTSKSDPGGGFDRLRGQDSPGTNAPPTPQTPTFQPTDKGAEQSRTDELKEEAAEVFGKVLPNSPITNSPQPPTVKPNDHESGIVDSFDIRSIVIDTIESLLGRLRLDRKNAFEKRNDTDLQLKLENTRKEISNFLKQNERSIRMVYTGEKLKSRINLIDSTFCQLYTDLWICS